MCCPTHFELEFLYLMLRKSLHVDRSPCTYGLCQVVGGVRVWNYPGWGSSGGLTLGLGRLVMPNYSLDLSSSTLVGVVLADTLPLSVTTAVLREDLLSEGHSVVEVTTATAGQGRPVYLACGSTARAWCLARDILCCKADTAAEQGLALSLVPNVTSGVGALRAAVQGLRVALVKTYPTSASSELLEPRDLSSTHFNLQSKIFCTVHLAEKAVHRRRKLIETGLV